MTEKEKEFMIQVALGVFSVDDNGNVWRHGQMMGGSRKGTDSYIKMFTHPINAATSIKGEYPMVMFSLGKRRRFGIVAHRIVWMIHNHSDIPRGLEINHKDGNKKNHHPSNLEVITRSQNVLHSFLLGRKTKAQQGEKNACAKLTNKDVMEIRQLWKQKSMTQLAIAKIYNTKQTTISNIVRGNTWKHLL